MKNKLIALIALVVGVSFSSNAQQEGIYSQYMDAQMNYNPATAGINDAFTVTGLHRQQWAGLKGAPITSGGIIQSPLRYESVGLGAEYYNQSIGPNNKMTVAANFAYRIPLGNDGKLAFGIKGLADFNTVDLSDISNVGTDEVALRMQKSFSANVGLGAIYRTSKWFLGLGVPRLLKSDRDSILSGGYDNGRHKFITGGFLFDVNEQWKFRATSQLRLARQSKTSAVISGAFMNTQGFNFGINLSSSWEMFGAFAQFEIAKVFTVGYAFDYGTSALNNVNYGTHEIMLTYTLNRKCCDVVPSYF